MGPVSSFLGGGPQRKNAESRSNPVSGMWRKYFSWSEMVQHVTVKNGNIFHPRRKKYEVNFTCNRPIRGKNDISILLMLVSILEQDMNSRIGWLKPCKLWRIRHFLLSFTEFTYDGRIKHHHCYSHNNDNLEPESAELFWQVKRTILYRHLKYNEIGNMASAQPYLCSYDEMTL